jgi:alpha-mannosidase
VLLTLKHAEDGRGLIARLWNMDGGNTTARLSLSLTRIARALRTNAVEEDEGVDAGELTVEHEHTVHVPMAARDTATVRLLLT